MTGKLEQKIKERGKRLLAAVSNRKLPIFQGLSGRILERCMLNVSFKTEMLRFIENLPRLTTPEATMQYLNHHFREQRTKSLPWPVRLFFEAIRYDNKLIAIMANKFIRAQTEKMAHVFLLNNVPGKAFSPIKKLRERGFACTVDIIGESSVGEYEAHTYRRSYYQLLESLEKEASGWQSLNCDTSNLDWDYSPKINIALKPSSLCSTLDPNNFEKSVKDLCRCIEPILLKAKEINAFVWIDMEQYKFKRITLEAYRQLRSDPVFREFRHFGIAIQSYLRDTDRDLANLLYWARDKCLPIAIRLVKGAYWDHEILDAKENGYEPPVYTRKAESDAAFERHAGQILENHDVCYLACASHNIRSIAAVIEMAEYLSVPKERYEFQVLYGMGELIGTAILMAGGRVRFYCPLGKPLAGIAYLVRRILENTASESVMRRTFIDGTDADQLLENPLEILKNG